MDLDLRGSLWSKWDLHVHTPNSLVHLYPGSSDDAWEAFISDLEALPSDFQVIGVNDYWFLDGYERLQAEKANGRLKNIRLFLPVIELRLNQFGGTDSKLSRVNYHVIFSDEISPQVIREQFLSALSRKFNIAPRNQGLLRDSAWSGVVTRSSIEQLGKEILENVPQNELHKYGTPLQEGFNNLTISIEAVDEALKSSFLRGCFITAVGKTEWADIKWKDGSIADKKHVINHADCVFTATDSIGAYTKAQNALRNAGVNDRLIDCSDAHSLSDSSNKDRIGNTFTWIKADPTFSGLLQAIEEFDQRVFVGDEPAQIQRIKEHPSKYIDRCRIRKIHGSNLSDHWFDTDLPLNSGLVAVIGNKGSGKSALAEVIGLLGGSTQEEHFSFLNPAKFRTARRQLASQFEGEIIWHGEAPQTALLSERVKPGAEARVQHLPQRYLESLCNEVPIGEKTEFDKQLERIIFAHLPSDMRLGTTCLDELVEIETGDIDAEISEKHDELNRTNHTIASLEKQLEPQAVEERRSTYFGLRREWRNLRRSVPEEVPESDESDPALVQVRQRIKELTMAEAHLSSLLENAESQLAVTRRRQADLSSFRAKLERLQRDHGALHQANAELLRSLDLTEGVSVFTVDVDALDATHSNLSEEIDSLSTLVHGASEDDKRALLNALDAVREERTAQRQVLSAPEEAREAYLQRLADWHGSLRALLGQRNSNDPATVLGARNMYFELLKMPEQLDELREARRKVAREIHGLLARKAEKCAALYAPLQEHMDAKELPEDYHLSVGTSLIDTGFSERFLTEMVNRQVSGSFSGKSESDRLMGDLLNGINFDDVESVLQFQEAIDRHLRFNMKDSQEIENPPSKQVRKGVTVADVYDWVYGQSYLSPRYGLLFGGKPIYQLSPGEKGTLLLIFFLLAEVDTRPLIIDQPEDNLDNNTVYRALVRCFQTAKSRRQVIIVTHNPNLAVVCDADQVIVASMEKSEYNRITYEPGAIERTDTISSILDILEGTHPAFLNRSVKYNIHIRA